MSGCKSCRRRRRKGVQSLSGYRQQWYVALPRTDVSKRNEAATQNNKQTTPIPYDNKVVQDIHGDSELQLLLPKCIWLQGQCLTAP